MVLLYSRFPVTIGRKKIENAAKFISEENDITIDEARTQVYEYLDGLRNNKDFMTANGS